ncbi:hypothetical protein D3C71_912660 [compost metagenome]
MQAGIAASNRHRSEDQCIRQAGVVRALVLVVTQTRGRRSAGHRATVGIDGHLAQIQQKATLVIQGDDQAAGVERHHVALGPRDAASDRGSDQLAAHLRRTDGAAAAVHHGAVGTGLDRDVVAAADAIADGNILAPQRGATGVAHTIDGDVALGVKMTVVGDATTTERHVALHAAGDARRGATTDGQVAGYHHVFIVDRIDHLQRTAAVIEVAVEHHRRVGQRMADFRRPRRAAAGCDVVDHFHCRGGQRRPHTGLAGNARGHLIQTATGCLHRAHHRRTNPQRAQPRYLFGIVPHPARPHCFFNLQQVQTQGFHTAPCRCLRRGGRVRGQLL